jgi:hypothetical protein
MKRAASAIVCVHLLGLFEERGAQR